jgi:hypothetical protein
MARRRYVMVVSDPWTLLISLEEEQDSLGCFVQIQEITLDGKTVDHWELHYTRVDEALRDLEVSYGIGPDDWIESD